MMTTYRRSTLGGILVAALLPGCESAPPTQRALPPPDVAGHDAEVAPVSSLGARPRTGAVAPNRLLSRGRPMVSWSPRRFAHAENLTDGDPQTVWEAGAPRPGQPAWVAIDIGVGPARLLLNWSAAGSFNYDETDYGSPGAYRVETSADSSDGRDGTWRPVVDVARVTTHAQEHSFDFAGGRWVRFSVTAAPALSPNGVQMDELEIRDATAGGSDTWFFMGDSITALAFGRSAGSLGFAERVRRRHPRRSPLMINGGIGGEKSDEGVRRIDQTLEANPDMKFWCLGYGTNDAAGGGTDPSHFHANMEVILDRVARAGGVAIMATIPFATDGQHDGIPGFNLAIEELARARSLPRGPDLYAWFHEHTEELRDGVHPNAKGIASINRLWAEAIDAL